MLRFTLTLCMLTGVSTYAEGELTPEILGKQFDAQVARLVERGYPALFGDTSIFDKEMARLREDAVKYIPAKPNYTFLIIIPETYAPLPWQLKQIKLTTLASTEVCNISSSYFVFRERAEFHNNGTFTVPETPYLIYDVDLGADTAKTWVCDVLFELPKACRRGLTLLECTALLIQRPELLSETKIAAIGTEIHDADLRQIPRFAYWYLYESATHYPIVDVAMWQNFNKPTQYNPYSNFRFPSCRLAEKE